MMKYDVFRYVVVYGLLYLLLSAGASSAEVRLGQSCPLTGPTANLGHALQKGAVAYFTRNAPHVALESLDDGYNPERCRKNTIRFLNKGVTALFSYAGTPTSKIAMPIAVNRGNIYFGALTGAAFLSDAAKYPLSFAVRASYDAEIESLIRHLKNDRDITKISIIVQRDAFGLACLNGVKKALKTVQGVSLVPAIPAIPADDSDRQAWASFWRQVPSYPRNTVNVGKAVRQVKGSGSEAVLVMATYVPCAAAMNSLHDLGFAGPMMAISPVGTALAKVLKDTSQVYVSQIVPNPWDASIPVVREYQRDLGADAAYGFISLEGYINAKVFHEALKMLPGGAVTSTELKTALESMMDYDIGGVKISYGPQDHRGMDEVYLTRMNKNSKGAIEFSYISRL